MRATLALNGLNAFEYIITGIRFDYQQNNLKPIVILGNQNMYQSFLK